MIDLSKQKLLIIAPHPDDEVLGCGGLIKRIKEEGGKVYILFLTVGDTSDFSEKGASSSGERIEEIEEVAKFLKFDDYELAYVGGDYHLKLDLVGQLGLMDLIERKSKVAVEKTKPTMVAFPSVFSYNQDHRIAASATQAALRPAELKNKHRVNLVLAYESPADAWKLQGNHEPNFFVRMTKRHLKTKLEAIKLYESQLRPRPNPRALEIVRALAALRGAQSGNHYAEGYLSYRSIS